MAAPWTQEERQLFKKGLEAHGGCWADLARFMGTRTEEQVRAYAAAMGVASAKGARAAMAANGSKKRARTAGGAGDGSSSSSSSSSSENHNDDGNHKAAKNSPAAAPGAPAARRATSSKKARGPQDGHWTEEEHQLFLACFDKYGKAWKTIADVMKTRSNEQIRTHAQKYFTKLEQLKHCGFEGDYSMDGTRHLTKSFVSKAQEDGRMGSTWPQEGWVNPLRAEKAARGRTATTTSSFASSSQATTSRRPSRRSARTRKATAAAKAAKSEPAEAEAEAEAEGKGEIEAAGTGIDDEASLPAPLPLPIPLPLPVKADVPICHHGAGPTTAMAALAEDLAATATATGAATHAGSTTATAGSESGSNDDDDDEDVKALYGGDMGSFLEFSDDNKHDDDRRHDDVLGELDGGLIFDLSDWPGCLKHGKAEAGEGGGKDAVPSSTDSVASSAASTTLPAAAAADAVLIGADGPTHNEDVLAPLLDTTSNDDACDSSIVAWGIEDEATNESKAPVAAVAGAGHQHEPELDEHGNPTAVYFQGERIPVTDFFQ